jgi:hypothetical protein
MLLYLNKIAFLVFLITISQRGGTFFCAPPGTSLLKYFQDYKQCFNCFSVISIKEHLMSTWYAH